MVRAVGLHERCDGVLFMMFIGLCLTFRGPCIVIYSYNKTNEKHQFLIFIFGIGLCMFAYGDCLLASSHHNLYDIYLLLCVQC